MGNAASGQNVNRPGKSSSFEQFDSRTSTPTKGGDSLTAPKGNTGVTTSVKSGGNPTGGSGGTAC